MSGPTPIMEQYLAVREEYPDVLIFFRMGDFYELFFEDAQTAAADLDIALTQRGTYQGQPIPMAGVPVHAADAYLARLIRKGHRVAVCEQLETPQAAKARGGKPLVKRGVVRLLTPGTLTEDTLLEPRAANLIAALGMASGGAQTALALADISTGRFELFVCSVSGLAEALAAQSLGELIVSEAMLAHPGIAEALQQADIPLAVRANVRARPKAGMEALKAMLQVTALDAFGTFVDAELSACALLLDYLALTQAGSLARLDPPARRGVEDFMAIDPATRASLEIARNTQGQREGSLLATIDHCLSAPGSRLLAERLARPLLDCAAIGQRLDAVNFFVVDPHLRDAVRKILKGMPDPERARMRLRLGRGGPRDLAALAQALRAGEQIAARLGEAPIEIAEAASALNLAQRPELAELAETLNRALAADLPMKSQEGGFIAQGYDQSLDEVRDLKKNGRAQIAELEARYVAKTKLSNLRIKHNNVLGYFIEIGAKHAPILMEPPHSEVFTHRQTLANSVRFTSVELAELESRISRADTEALAREMALFAHFVQRLDALSEALAQTVIALARLDVSCALAHWAQSCEAVRPELVDSQVFAIEGGRHPVVEAARRAQGDGFVSNDCHLDSSGEAAARLLLVTGPNMAGKSTWLRQNALMAILAQAGSFVPARQARIGIVDRVFSRVGAADDLARGRSTFMVEMIETAAILNQAKERSLVILDEVGRGTATYDGLAIAWAVVEHLYEINACRTLFATHYHELTGLAVRLPHADNVSLRAKEWKGDLVFLHEVCAGASDKSYGVQAARLAGLPNFALKRARQILQELEQAESSGDKLGDLPLFTVPESDAEDCAPMDETHAILADTDIDSLTPREALALLYRLKDISQSPD